MSLRYVDTDFPIADSGNYLLGTGKYQFVAGT